MHKEFYLPDLGEGLASAKITEWHVSEGDELKVDQPLCSVETTKAIVEIPAPYSGKLIKFSAQTGVNLEIGATICVIAPKKMPLMASARKNNTGKKNLTGYSMQGLNANQAVMFHKLANQQQQPANATLTELAKISKKINTSDLVIALVKALVTHPIFNASYCKKDGLKKHDNIDIGIAMQAKTGLYIACIESAEILSREEIANKISAAKNNVSSLENTNKARMTLSNIGSTGAGIYATPSIMPKSLATLATGRVITQAQWHNDSWQPIQALPLSLSFDHRIITGAEAAEFLKTFMENL